MEEDSCIHRSFYERDSLQQAHHPASTHDLHHIDDVMKALNRKKGKALIDGIAGQHELYRKWELLLEIKGSPKETSILRVKAVFQKSLK